MTRNGGALMGHPGSRAGLAQGDGRAQPVQEVLEGGLGHPVQQDPVDGLAEDAQGWAVAGADGQLGPVLAQGAQLEVGVQPGEQALQAVRLPGQRQRGHRGEADRLAQRDRDPPPQPRPERGPTPTAPSSPSPRRWAAPATADSHPAEEPTNACLTTATGSGTST
jgi:hypothetical protein